MESFMRKFISGMLRLLQKHYAGYLALVVVAMAVSIYCAFQLELRSGFEDLLPQNNTAVQILKQIPQKVGGAKYVKIAVTNDNNFDAAKRFVEDYVKALKNYPEIQFIKYKTGNRFFKEHFLQYLDVDDLEQIRDKISSRIEYEKRVNNPFYFGLEDEQPPSLDFLDMEGKYKSVDEFKDESYYATKDHKVIFILARPKGFASDIKYSRRLLGEMNAIADRLNPKSYDPSLQVHLLGAHFANMVEYDALVSDVTSTSTLSFVLLFLLFYLYCRRFKVLMYIIVPPVVSVIWTFGATYFMIGHINTQTAFLAAILLGLVDVSIHLTSRYQEERQHGKDIFTSLELMLRHAGYAVIVSSVTLFISFLSLIFSDFVGFWQFGLIAATGVALSVIANCTIIPALIFCFEKDGAVATARDERNLFTMYAKLVDKIRPSRVFQRWNIAIWAMVGLACAFLTPKIQFEYDLRNLRSTAFTNEELTNRLEEITGGGTTPSAIFLTDGLDDVRDLDTALNTLKENPNSTIRDVKDVYSLVPRDLDKKMHVIGQIKREVDRGEKFLKLAGKNSDQLKEFKKYLSAAPVRMEDVPEEFLVEFRDPNGKLGSFVMIYPKAEEAQMQEMMGHAAEVRAVKGASGKMYYSSGESIIFADMMKLMKVDGRRAIILTFFGIFLVILLQTRRLKNTLIALTPLYVGVLLICGMMVLFDIKLNFFNIIMFPMILGIGVDSNVHIFERFVEFGYTNVKGAMRSVGRGILLTTLTTIIGFASLLYAKSKALNSMGVLAVTGVGLCCVTAMVFLPALMSLTPFRKEREQGAHATETHADPIAKAN